MSYQRASINLLSCAPDLMPQDAPENVWDDAVNVYFRDGQTVRATGDVPTLPGASEARTAVFIRVGVQPYWVYADENGIYAHDGTTEFDITPVSGWTGVSIGATWTSCTMGGIAYLNRSDMDPVYWAGSTGTPATQLPDWPSGGRCVSLRASNNFLFAIGMTNEGPGQRVRWSDAAEPGTVPGSWAPDADNLAGFIDLAPTSSPCRDGMDVAGEFFIFKEESIHALRFTGGNVVWTARQAFREHGLRAANGWVRGPNDEIMFMGNDGDVYLTDGVQVRSVLDGRAQREVYAGLTASATVTLSGVLVSREKLGFLVYPDGGDVFRALVYDFTSGAISFRQMPQVLCAAAGELLGQDVSITWDSDSDDWQDATNRWNDTPETGTIDDAFIGGAFGFYCISQTTDDQFAGGDIEVRLEKSGISMGDAQRRKLVARAWPKVVGRNGDTLSFRFGGQEVTGGPVQLSDPQTFVIGQDTHLDVFASGRFLSMEVTSTGGNIWRMGSFDFEYRPQGNF